MEPLALRRLGPDDVPAMMALARGEDRNVHPRELERFVGLEGAHAIGITRGDELAGVITVMRQFEHGWLGPALLADGDDAVGVLALLLAQAVRGLQVLGVERIETEATRDEVAILEPLGFHPVRRTLVMERPAGSEAAPAHLTVPLEERHLLDLGALDAAAAGYGRKEYLWALATEFPQGARAIEGAEGLRGHALLRRTRRGYMLGPLVTETDDMEAASALLRDAVAEVPSWPVVALVPEESPLLPELEKAGFRKVAELTRLRAGEPPGAREATEWIVGGRMTG